MKKNDGSKDKSSNIVLKIGITYIIPIFLAICGAVMIFKEAWSYTFERFYFSPNINSEESKIKLAEFNINGQKVNKPFLYQQFATITVNSIGINEANIYEGYRYDTLKLGIGHHISSKIPGEGGVTVLLGYGSMEFGKLKNINIGEEVLVTTSYGKYYYKVYDTKIVEKTDENFIDYNEKVEKLIMYTDYPFDAVGETNQYFVVSCSFEKVE